MSAPVAQETVKAPAPAAAPAAAATPATAPAHSIPYVKLWFVLVGALVVSLVLAGFEHHRLAAALIFAIAIAKAAIVAMYYMHLRFEPRYVILVVLSGLVCLTVLFAGLLLDIVHVYGG